MKTVTVCLSMVLCLFASGPAAYCELPPGSYDELKKEASEVLKVEILGVQKSSQDEKVVYTAKVLKVERSGTQLKEGDDIRIHSYHFAIQRRGPVNAPLLATGWNGIVYLNKGTGEDKDEGKKEDYCIAAYGQSFEQQ